MRELEGQAEPFYTPEEIVLLKRQFAEQFSSGIHDSFVHAMDTILVGPPDPHSPYARAARTEAPLRLILQRNWFTDEDGNKYGTGYFLEKFNPATGETLSTEDDMDIVMSWVAFLDENGNIIEKREVYTDEQINLLYHQGQELTEIGLA